MAAVPERFINLVAAITAAVAEKPLDEALDPTLTSQFPPHGPVFAELEALCRQGCAEGWLCAREAGGIKFGRAIRPSPQTCGFSVDVVDMNEIVGPHHSHPNGEIDMIMPIDSTAKFDGVPRGWRVYPPGSAHYPTVSGGRALVLYLLPQGAIEFTRADAQHI